jgi:hypothetical protein
VSRRMTVAPEEHAGEFGDPGRDDPDPAAAGEHPVPPREQQRPGRRHQVPAVHLLQRRVDLLVGDLAPVVARRDVVHVLAQDEHGVRVIYGGEFEAPGHKAILATLTSEFPGPGSRLAG